MAESDASPGRNLYAVLGLAPQATAAEIRAAHERLLAEIASGARPSDEQPVIEEAFQTLNDPVRRLRYDARAAAPPTRPAAPDPRRPGRRTAPVRRGRRILPPILGLDPLLVGAIVLVALLAIAVLLVPLLRRGGSAPRTAQVAPTQTSATGAASPSPSAARPGAAQPTVPPLIGLQGGAPSSLIPLTPGASTGSLVLPSAPGLAPNLAQGGEPPFLTRLALGDMVQAVVAAAAVRNGPSTATLPAAPAAAAPRPAPAANAAPPAPAGVPITSVGALPPVSLPGQNAAGAQPGQTAAGAAPVGAPGSVAAPGQLGQALTATLPGGAPAAAAPATPTPRPIPNRITVPATPVTVAGGPLPAPATPPSGTTAAPNRIGAPATPPVPR